MTLFFFLYVHFGSWGCLVFEDALQLGVGIGVRQRSDLGAARGSIGFDFSLLGMDDAGECQGADGCDDEWFSFHGLVMFVLGVERNGLVISDGDRDNGGVAILQLHRHRLCCGDNGGLFDPLDFDEFPSSLGFIHHGT